MEFKNLKPKTLKNPFLEAVLIEEGSVKIKRGSKSTSYMNSYT